VVTFSGIEKSWLKLLRTYRFNGKDNGQYNAAEAVVTLEDLKAEKTLENLEAEDLEAVRTRGPGAVMMLRGQCWCLKISVDAWIPDGSVDA